jgi:uncharacterized membrane protein
MRTLRSAVGPVSSLAAVALLAACSNDATDRRPPVTAPSVPRAALAAAAVVVSPARPLDGQPAEIPHPDYPGCSPPYQIPDFSFFFPCPIGPGPRATAINDEGVVGITGVRAVNSFGVRVGYSGELNPSFNGWSFPRAFKVVGGTVVPLPDGAPGVLGSRAWGINDLGDIVGTRFFHVESDFAPPWAMRPRATLWRRDGAVIDLGAVNPTGGSEAFAINNRGQAVGVSGVGAYLDGTSLSRHPVMFAGGLVTDLGVPSGCVSGAAFAINDRGQVAGMVCGLISAEGVGGLGHAVVWDAGVRTALPEPSGAFGSIARGINEAGDVVGSVEVGSAGWDPYYEYVAENLMQKNSCCGTHELPVLWRGGAVTTLPLLPGTYQLGGAANDVNNRGEVVGHTVVSAATRPTLWVLDNATASPTVTPAGASTVGAGASFSAQFRFADASTAGPWRLTIDWGDGTAPLIATSSVPLTAFPLVRAHTYARAGQYVVRVTTVNKAGVTHSATLAVTVL